MRLDKFLWSVRLYKSRSLAAEACRKGQVQVNGQKAKPARILTGNETLKVKLSPIWRSYKILSLLKSRVAGKLVENYLQEITPQKELDHLEEIRLAKITYDRGSGRPTKKQRRELDKARDGWNTRD